MEAQRGHFRLESGHRGELWLECDRLYRRPVELRELVGELAARVRRYQPDVVCGPVTGGAFLAWEVARVLNTQFRCTVAQSPPGSTELYSTVYRLSDPAELVDAKVVVVDDVINAGSAVRSTLEQLTAAASKPVALAALLGLGEPVEELAREYQIDLELLARSPNTLWLPADCPACAAGHPIDRRV